MTSIDKILQLDLMPNMQVGNVLFRMPDGWTKSVREGLTILAPLYMPEGKQTYIMILPGQDISGELFDMFNQEWESMKEVYTVHEGGEVKAVHTRGGYDTVYTVARAFDKEDNDWYIFFLFARAVDRVESFLFMSNEDEAVVNYDGLLGSFLGSLTFANLNQHHPGVETSGHVADPVWETPSFKWGRIKPPEGDAGLDGLYGSYAWTSRMDYATGLYITEPVYKYWVFFPDGTCFACLPTEGLENYNMEYARRWNPTWYGIYQLSGDGGKIYWGEGQKTVWDLALNKTGFRVRKENYQLLDRCNDLEIEGTYRLYNYMNEFAYKQGIEFTRGGDFIDEGILKAAGAMWNFDEGLIADKGVPGKGSYWIKNNTLELIYDDGRKKRINIHLPVDPSDEKNGDVLIINTRKFVRI